MVKLYQFSPNPKTRNFSPFCLKMETYLRMAGIPYESIAENNPAKGPKKKLPFIEHEGRRIPDSAFIIEYLKETYGDKLDSHLSRLEQAQAIALTSLMETDLIGPFLYSRWIDEPGWSVTRSMVFGRLPFPLRLFVPGRIQKRIRQALYVQGTGRHSRDEIYHIGSRRLTALAEILGKKSYFFGDKPSTVDAVAYGFLKNILSDGIGSPLQRHAEKYDNLAQFCHRIEKKYYSESASGGEEKKPRARRTARAARG